MALSYITTATSDSSGVDLVMNAVQNFQREKKHFRYNSPQIPYLTTGIDEIMASFSRLKSVAPVRTSNDELTDSVDEVEIVKELKATLDTHQCDVCCEGSFLLNKLLQFGGVINSSKKYGCEICCKGFGKKIDHSNHMKLHQTEELNSDIEIESATMVPGMSSDTKVVCKICDQQCKSDIGLKRHMTNQHKKEISTTHECEICNASFKSFKQFSRHCLSHSSSKKKLLQCSQCNKKFLWKNNLKGHVCNID